MMSDKFNFPSNCDPRNVWAIKPTDPEKRSAMGKSVYYTIVTPWNRGFYATVTPKLFTSEERAQTFIQENDIQGDPIKGFIAGSQGFFEGEFQP